MSKSIKPENRCPENAVSQYPSDQCEFTLKELVDIPAFQNMLESFSRLTGISTAILELDGQILAAVGWQSICRQYHRQNRETARRCLESDTALARQLKQGEKYNVYQCKNGLVEVAVPIVIEDMHIGNLFAGQFFFEPPDMDFFARQAEACGFDKTEYLDSLAKVPVLTADRVKQATAFLTHLTVIIGNSALDKKRLMELNKTLEQKIQQRTVELQTEIKIRRAEQQFSESLINSLPAVMYVFDQFGKFERWNKNVEIVTGYAPDLIRQMNLLDFIAEEDKAAARKAIDKVFQEGSAFVEARLVTMGGQVIPYLFTGFHFVQEEMNYLVGVGLDISDRVRNEKEKENLIRKLQDTLSQVKQLSGFLPICASCKKIRDDEGYWKQIEAYIREHSEVEFSHSICPDCARKLYPDWKGHQKTGPE